MELKEPNYFRLVFDEKEFFLKTEFEDSEALWYVIHSQSAPHPYIKLQLQDNEPTLINLSKLSLIQKVGAGIIGHQTKVWSMVV